MKKQTKLFVSSVLLITTLLFSCCTKVSNIKSDDAISSFSFKNKSTEQLNSDEILKYSINNDVANDLVFNRPVKINFTKDFTNNQMNLRVWVENKDGVILSNVNNILDSKEMYLEYKTISITLNRNNLLRTSNGNSNLLHGNTIIIGSGHP
jgi:hypothetical protein